MEDQVSFKVYTLWKKCSMPEVRRFGVDKTVVTSYTYLLAKIHDVFPNLKEKTFTVSWKDEEGDDVRVSSDEEVMTMLAAVPGQLFKLYVLVENNGAGAAEPHAHVNMAYAHPTPPIPFVFSGRLGVHVGVRCDSCNRGVLGFRYKCITCDDFDLCGHCEARGAHSDHCFVRIPDPLMSPQVIKDSIKKSRMIINTFAASIHEAQKKTSDLKKAACPAATAHIGCPILPVFMNSKIEAKLAAKERREERREERNEKRQEKIEKRHDRREEVRRDRRENPHERAGWMDMVSKYVDQFANLAADHIRVANGDSAGQSSQAAQDAPNPYLDPNEFAKMMNACMNLRASGCPLSDLIEQEGGSQDSTQGSTTPARTASAPLASQTAATQAPTTSQVVTQVPTTPLASTQAPITPQAPTQAPITASQVAPNPVMPVEDPKADKSDASSVSSVEVASRDASPDKSAEDWTMINNEKDLEPDAGAANPVQIDSNLPEEFQYRPGAAYGLIYPPLNAATAVYNPQEPVVVPAKAEAPAPTTQAQTQAPPVAPRPQHTQGYIWPIAPQAGYRQTEYELLGQAAKAGSLGQGLAMPGQAKPGQASAPAGKPSAPQVNEPHHRVPHIDAAIRQMISMGFTNEGGWLTQLVESKDGNIAAVLDLLTPVKPNK